MSEDEDDRPRPWRKPRRGREDRDEEPEEEEEEKRPRRRRRRPDPLDDPSLAYVLPVNTSLLAIAAGYLGLISVLCFPAPLALLLGVLAIRQLNSNPKLHGRGRAFFGIVMGVIFTIPLPFLVYVIITHR